MKTFKLFFNSLFFIIRLHAYLFCGFAPNTLVLTPNGYIAIQDIKQGDIVVSVTKEGKPSLTEVLHTVIKTEQQHFKLTISQCTRHGNLKNEIAIANQPIMVAQNQKFFRIFDHKWVKAKDLEANTIVSAATLPSVAKVTEVTQYFNGITLYDLNLKDDHAFCVSDLNIVVHNCGVITALWFNSATNLATFGQVIASAGFAGATATLLNIAIPAVCIASAVVFVAMEVVQSQAAKPTTQSANKNSNSVQNSKAQQTPNIKGPDKDPDDDWFEKLKKIAKEKAFHQKFKKIYKDPQTSLWWSKDIDNHGGSIYKVFKEAARGLEWVFDADALGQKILDKHKSPVGKFIPYKELIFY